MASGKTEKIKYAFDWTVPSDNAVKEGYLFCRLNLHNVVLSNIIDTYIIKVFSRPKFRYISRILPSYTERAFPTIEDAKNYADNILSENGYKTIPKHLAILL
jgi:hypothetical protein